MNRRDTLKTLMAASAGLVALPSWAQGWSVESLASHASTFSVAEQEILSAVADTIIPAGDSIGALTVGVDVFLQKLFDRCYETEVQDNIRKQLSALASAAREKHGKQFAACDQARREELLLAFASSDDERQSEFFKLIKSETIRGFSTSKEVMVDFHKYKVAPGHYYGCVDVNT